MPNPEQKRKLRDRLAAIWGWHCWWCRVPLNEWSFTFEHLYPVALGGTWKIDNLRLACSFCNELRGCSTLPPATCRWTTPPRPIGADPASLTRPTPTATATRSRSASRAQRARRR